LKLNLELELNVVLRPFGTKPVAKYVALDKFSAVPVSVVLKQGYILACYAGPGSQVQIKAFS